MDDQNDQSNQYGGQNTPTEIPPAYVPPETPPPAQPFPVMPQAPEQPVHGTSRKKLMLLVISLLLAIVVIVGLAWLFITYGKSTPHSDSSSAAEQPTKTTVFSQPENLIYARGDGKDAPYTLYARSVTSDTQVEAITLPSRVSFTGFPGNATHGNQVTFATTDAATSQDSIYYSKDSGKSYTKIYTGPQGAQITSVVFASNGKALAIGLNPSLTSGNQVTEISLEGEHQTKTLFKIDEAGVFLKGYDQEKQKTVYFSGCYNCDGNTMKDLRLYDIAARKQETLYSATNRLDSLEINKDFTKILIAEGTPSSASGDPLQGMTRAPYLLSLLDIASKTKETVITIDGGELREVGYTPDGEPYAVTNKRVFKIANGKLNTIFETTGVVSSASTRLFVGDNTAVTGVSPDDANGTAQVLYTKDADAEPVEILKMSAATILLGVTRK